MFEDGREIVVNKFRFMPGIDMIRFKREIKHLMRLKHENIAQIVSFCNGMEESTWYIGRKNSSCVEDTQGSLL